MLGLLLLLFLQDDRQPRKPPQPGPVGVHWVHTHMPYQLFSDKPDHMRNEAHVLCLVDG